jgi:hypothetical protein
VSSTDSTTETTIMIRQPTAPPSGRTLTGLMAPTLPAAAAPKRRQTPIEPHGPQIANDIPMLAWMLT